jgi:hypothetical protein
MAVAIKYSQQIVWGTTGAGTLASQGVILSASRKRTSEVFEQKNANGENHSVIFYDPKEEISVEVLAAPSATVPVPGDEVTVAGVTAALVLDAEEVWSNNDAKKIRMTLKKWIAA